jgi:hypothetical protein
VTAGLGSPDSWGLHSGNNSIEHPGRENLSARRADSGERAVYRKIAKALDGLKAGIHVEHAY